MKPLLSIIFFLISVNLSYAQSPNQDSHPQINIEKTKISISIDDVPNTKIFQSDNYRSILLEKLDSLDIPIAIFVNEGLIYQTDATSKNIWLLESWAKRNYITLGNHTFSHSRYSDVGYNGFKTDIDKGENILRKLAHTYNKPLNHFRFPYNDLGKDSLQHRSIDSLLRSKDYRITPFTVESSDWMFNAVYEHYLSDSEYEKAADIGKLYLSKTLDYIQYFVALSDEIYGRSVNQIYLCHDNAINRDYLVRILDSLAADGYEFVSIDEAMEDSAYQQENPYYQKWGISWMYRWMTDPDVRRHGMTNEPDLTQLESLYNGLRQ